MTVARRLRYWALLLLAFFLVHAGPSIAAKRIALVIGNDAYREVTTLERAANDARAMGETLKGLGFEVITATDITRREMNRKLLAFVSRIEPADEAMVFYAGHAVEIGGLNYLLPIDIPNVEPGMEDLITAEAVPLNRILGMLRGRRARVNILVLDACRDNPFSTRAGRNVGNSRGLARVEPPEGTFIMYSAGAGQRALDSLGKDDPHPNSVYTRTLIPLMQEAGLSLVNLARRARAEVSRLVAGVEHEQRPAYYDEMKGEFFFKNRPARVARPSARLSGGASPDPETVFWLSVQGSDDPRLFEAYLAQYPTGLYAPIARIELDRLRAVAKEPSPPAEVKAEGPNPAAPTTVVAGLSVTPMQQTLVAVKNSNVRDQPSPDGKKVGFLPVDRTVEVTGKLSDRDWYRVKHNGKVAYVYAPLLQAVDPAEHAAWQRLKESRNAEDFKAFLGKFPDGIYAGRARKLMAAMRRPRKPGETFKDCDACPHMVVLPPGSFVMGSPVTEAGREASEGPVHRVRINAAFAVSKFEVTFAEWQACRRARGCRHRPNDYGYGRGNRPVIDVSWNDAKAYVQWLSGETKQTYRLLSEAEWEYAARAGTQTMRPWGDKIGIKFANCDGCGSSWDDKRTAPIGSFRANAFGLHDMLGNVSEWTADCWNRDYGWAPRDGSAWTAGDCRRRVLRGGSWFYGPWTVRSAYRIFGNAAERNFDIGFRIARDLEPKGANR